MRYYCLLFISGLHPVSVTLCRYLIRRTAEWNATTLLLPSPMLAACRCQPSVCPIRTAKGGCSPECPDVGRTAALSKELQAERKCGGLHSPKLPPKGIYFRQTGAKVYTTLFQQKQDKGLYVNHTPVQTSAVEAQSLHAPKPRKTDVLEPREDLPLLSDPQ